MMTEDSGSSNRMDRSAESSNSTDRCEDLTMTGVMPSSATPGSSSPTVIDCGEAASSIIEKNLTEKDYSAFPQKPTEGQSKKNDSEDEENEIESEIASIESDNRIKTWIDRQQNQVIVDETHRNRKTVIPKILPVQSDEHTAAFAEPIHPPSRQIPTENPVVIEQPIKDEVRKSSEIAELASAITMAIKSGQSTTRHSTELPYFNGAFQEWLTFKAAVQETLHLYSDVENISRLRRCLKGKARESVERMLYTTTSPQDIMRSLETRFGRPDSIAIAEIEQLRSLPRPTENPREICIFASKVNNIIATLQTLGREYYLYNPEITKITIDKLSPTLRHEWYKFTAEHRENLPDLLKLGKFLEKEADIASPYATPEYIDARPPQHQRKSHHAYANSEYRSTEPKACHVCNIVGHGVIKCPTFVESDNNRRWELAKMKQLCFRCLLLRDRRHTCQKKACGINNCNKTHHSLLHFERAEVNSAKKEENKEAINSTWQIKSAQTFLKIVPITVSGPAGEAQIHALLDDGSTVTLIDSEVAKQIGVKGYIDPLYIEAISDKISAKQSRRVSLTLKKNQNSFRVTARTMPNLQLALQKVEERDIDNCSHLTDIKEQIIYSAERPRMLIGQDNWNLLLSSETRKGNANQPVASLTPLGWVLHGSTTRTLGRKINFVHHTATTEDRMEEELKKYFAIESLTITPKLPQSDQEQKALNMLKENTRKIENSYYEAPLLWKNQDVKMPNNYEQAVNRLYSIEKKIDKDPFMKEKYEQQMASLISKGYAEKAPESHTDGRTWYLPHFGVVNPMKPDKLRIVHDAAAITKGVSLNNQLLTGPDLLKSLPGVLMRFRQHKIAVSADIAEMFMQVKVRPEDRDALRYLWRGKRREGPPDEYRMSSLIFGATCSPSIAIYVKNLNAEKYRDSHPRAVKAIVHNHYVDDYLDSFSTEEEATEIAKQVREIHRNANYDLRQWSSNSPIVQQALIDERAELQKTTVKIDDNHNKAERVLGLIWKPNVDELTFNLNLSRLPKSLMSSTDSPTKREVLKIMMSLYDPLGLASPVVIKSKQIMQEIWRRGISWDNKIDEDLTKQWIEWLQQLSNLSRIPIPRAYLYYTDSISLQLHVFTDASELAYAASVYWRTVTADGQVHVTLVLGKAKVAPLKLTSIPRLELQAAVMGSRMAETVIEEHDRKPESVTYWTDSKTVLTWLRNGTRNYKPFVAHRIAAIEEISSVKDWRWVPTKQNVADDATREVPQEFNENHRWFQGPDFLRGDPNTWPCENYVKIEKTGEEKVNFLNETGSGLLESIPDSSRFSKWEKLVRTTGRVLQFISLCRKKIEQVHYKKTTKRQSHDPDWNKKPRKPIAPTKQPHEKSNKNFLIPLKASTLIKAEELLIRGSQISSFQGEVEDLKNNRQIPKSSRLRPLAITFIDGILRLKSRIDNAIDITENQRTPPIIDGDHKISQLWIEYTHRKLNHAGTETTINECRQHYWVLRLRPTTKKIIHRCIPCRMRNEKPSEPQTGNHPHCRLGHHQRPFTYTGVDYFGPISVSIGRRHEKRYIALFTCLTTRAVHLEVADTLSTDSAIMALRRLIARRGQPTEIWSDNGTNLRGADKEIRANAIKSIHDEANTKGIKWKFIPPGAPFMGGAWERLVRSVKTAMKAVLQDRYPTDEVLRTIITEAEYTVNSRPLTHVSVNSEDPEALTPNHFLLGGSSRVSSIGEFDENILIGRSTWKKAQRLADHFWHRWLLEYLPELQNRRQPHSKGLPLKIGNVVLIADNNLPRNIWPKGVIIAVYPGKDGIVRTVDVKTRGGIMRRPTKKLIVLPTD